MIFPGGHGSVNTGPVTLNTQIIDALKKREVVFYVFGRVEYLDVSKIKTRHTRFCFWLTPDLDSMSSCDTYNEAD